MHDDVDARIRSALGRTEPGAPPPSYIEAVRRRRVRSRRRVAGAVAGAVVALVGGLLYVAPAGRSAGEPEPLTPDRARTARSDRPSFGSLSTDPEWISTISLIDFTPFPDDEPPIALRMSGDQSAIEAILDRMMTGS